MNMFLCTLAGTLFTFGMTTIGAASVFFLKKEKETWIQSAVLGFAGGVMIAASVWSLLIPAMDYAKENGQIEWVVTTAGVITGVVLLLVVDNYLEKWMVKKDKKSTTILVAAITAHNIPEGMAIGLAFAMAGLETQNAALFSGAVALAIGIGIQNLPEGTAVALPLMQNGIDRKKAFLIGSMSSIVEPIFGVVAVFIASVVRVSMPFLLSFAAGCMIYVVIQELIPEACNNRGEKKGTLGFVVGFLIMMILDVALA